MKEIFLPYEERISSLNSAERSVRADILKKKTPLFSRMPDAALGVGGQGSIESLAFAQNGPNFYVSWRSLLQGLGSRIFNTSKAGEGGELVGEQSAGIEAPLYARSVLGRLGANITTGWKGEVPYPATETEAVGNWMPETGENTPQSPTYKVTRATPHRVVGEVEVSRQLCSQSPEFADEYIREQLAGSLAAAIDKAGMQGSGASGEPLGLTGTDGLESVTAGAAFDFANLADMEDKIISNHADPERIGAVVAADVRKKLRQKDAGTDGGSYLLNTERGSDWLMGWPAQATKNAPDGALVIGEFSKLKILLWSQGITVLANPFTKKRQGIVIFTAEAFSDIVTPRPELFCRCLDANL